MGTRGPIFAFDLVDASVFVTYHAKNQTLAHVCALRQISGLKYDNVAIVVNYKSCSSMYLDYFEENILCLTEDPS